jgi:hypothetical protein
MVVTAVWWSLVTVMVAALMAGFGQQLGRLCLDAVIQRDVHEKMRSNAFARSETSLQLSWVLGGGVGAFQPWATLELGETGLSIGVWSSFGINDRGTVVGSAWSVPWEGGESRAVLWRLP